jgi:hypothetical protein
MRPCLPGGTIDVGHPTSRVEEESPMPDSSSKTTIAVAAIGAMSALGAAALANWDKISRSMAADPAPHVVAAPTPAPAPPAPQPAVAPTPAAQVTTTAASEAGDKAPPFRMANFVGDWKSTTTVPGAVFGTLRLRAEGSLLALHAFSAQPCRDAAGCAYAAVIDPARESFRDGRREWQLPKTPVPGATWVPAGTTAISMNVTRNVAEPHKLYAHVTLYGERTVDYDDVFIRQ